MRVIKELKEDFERWDKEMHEEKSESDFPKEYYAMIMDTAKEIMGLLDNWKYTPEKAFWKTIKDSGISGYQSGWVANIVCLFHPRGAEFKAWWNKDNWLDEKNPDGWKDQKGITNPAIICIGNKE